MLVRAYQSPQMVGNSRRLLADALDQSWLHTALMFSCSLAVSKRHHEEHPRNQHLTSFFFAVRPWFPFRGWLNKIMALWLQMNSVLSHGAGWYGIAPNNGPLYKIKSIKTLPSEIWDVSNKAFFTWSPTSIGKVVYWADVDDLQFHSCYSSVGMSFVNCF